MPKRKIEEKRNLEALRENKKKIILKKVAERNSKYRKEKSIQGEWEIIKQTINITVRNNIGIRKVEKKNYGCKK